MILANYGVVSSSGGVSFDTDALSFITAAAITDNTQKTAINTLVTDLKTYNIWTKMKALYPFVGGTASTHKWNLKDPRDLDAAFRLTFNGGWSHSSNGITGNALNTYARTYFVDTNLSINSSSYSIYNRTNTSQSGQTVDFGYLKLNSSYISNLFSVNYSPVGYGGRVQSFTTTNATRTDYRGYYNGNRNNSADFNFHVNGVKTITGTESTSGKLLTGYEFYLGCLYIDGSIPATANYSTNNYAFAHISDGLTDTEASNLYTAVQTFNTTLSRQV